MTDKMTDKMTDFQLVDSIPSARRDRVKRNYLKEDSREKKWPKGEDPSHQNNQTPSKTCVGIDVVPGV